MLAFRAPAAFNGERFMPGGATVIVEDGVIKGVESVGYEVPADCPLATFEGTMLPGLFDAHVHLVLTQRPEACSAPGRSTPMRSTTSSTSRCGNKRLPV
jgi:imidazolonepropionase-like amidohydrolase